MKRKPRSTAELYFWHIAISVACSLLGLALMVSWVTPGILLKWVICYVGIIQLPLYLPLYLVGEPGPVILIMLNSAGIVCRLLIVHAIVRLRITSADATRRAKIVDKYFIIQIIVSLAITFSGMLIIVAFNQ